MHMQMHMHCDKCEQQLPDFCWSLVPLEQKRIWSKTRILRTCRIGRIRCMLVHASTVTEDEVDLEAIGSDRWGADTAEFLHSNIRDV